ncbi:MAG: hypothetical protein J5927_04300 [Oscillospiraceae bacterium]|nr:hypothetical protein [Oscillospiraceae bacterium]
MNEKKTTLIYRIIRFFVWLFSPKFKVQGAENLPDGPCVIVGNHSQMYGPIAGELFFLGPRYIWCAGQMMHWKEVPDYAYTDFWSFKPKAVRWFFRLCSYLITPLAVCVFNNAHTIPVYHDTRLLTTFRESIALLQEGYRIIIFPEYNKKYNNILYDFQDKFIDLARFYYKKTGQELSFVPLYVAPNLGTMHLGQPIRFRAGAPIAEERRRICDGLMAAITDLAISLPEHRVVPYRNIAKRSYPHNIPLEVYSDEKATG